MDSEITNNHNNDKFWKTSGLYLVCGLLAVIIMTADIAVPLGVAIPVLYIIVVWLSLWSPHRSLTFHVSVVCCLLTIGVFFYQAAVTEMWKAVLNRLIAVLAIWVTAFLGMQRKKSEEKREKAVQEREKALEETRILRGLLPICASCKKIRDDKGYWIQIEKYIKDRSHAEFSHGICPECAKKLYQDMDE